MVLIQTGTQQQPTEEDGRGDGGTAFNPPHEGLCTNEYARHAQEPNSHAYCYETDGSRGVDYTECYRHADPPNQKSKKGIPRRINLRRDPSDGEYHSSHKGEAIGNYYPAYDGSPREGLVLVSHGA